MQGGYHFHCHLAVPFGEIEGELVLTRTLFYQRQLTERKDPLVLRLHNIDKAADLRIPCSHNMAGIFELSQLINSFLLNNHVPVCATRPHMQDHGGFGKGRLKTIEG